MNVFAYGSLIWDSIPFPHTSQPTFLKHHELRLCIWSIQGRGTKNTPGLYWGIVKKRGTRCPGKLLRFTDQKLFHKVLQWLDRRESEGKLYHRISVEVSGTPTFVYVPNTTHPQYNPNIAPEKIEYAIRNSKGEYGTTKEYVENTLREFQLMRNFIVTNE